MSNGCLFTPLRRLLVLLGALAASVVPAAPASAAPGSDDFGSAPELLFSVGGVVDNKDFTTQGADEPGPSPPGPTCPAMFRTAWWRITGTGQPITLTTRESTFDTVLAVYNTGGLAPIPGNRIACNDTDPDPLFTGDTAALTFASTRGLSYLVAVGGKTAGNFSFAFGTIDLRASAPRPANDDRIAPQALTTGVPATVDNHGASHELGETRTCGSAEYAATMWFRWTAPAVGDAVFSSAASFDTVVMVYRAGDGVAIGCDAASARPVSLRVSPGDYIIQVGSKGPNNAALGEGAITTKVAFTLDPDVDNDGALASVDCNDNNGSIRPGIADVPDDAIDQNCDGSDAVNFDRDGDGSSRPGDCNDANAAIHPGASDVPGNKIDEDCDGRDAAFPRLVSTVRSFFAFPPLRFTSLTIVRAVAGSRVELRCRGGGCFKRPKVIPVRTSRALLSLQRYVRTLRIRRGAVVDIRITKRDNVGFMRRVTSRGNGRTPKIQDYCLPVGAGKPTRC